MNFSMNKRFSKLLSMILVLVMIASLFAGCKKNDLPEDTEGSLNLNLSETSTPTETQTTPPETTAPVINEDTATVLNDIIIRGTPNQDATPVGNLKKGERIEIERIEDVFGTYWAYIKDPAAGWVMMEYLKMDIPVATQPENTDTPAATEPDKDKDDDKDTNTTNIKGVINVNGLNIRSEGNTTTGKIQGSYNKGDVVTILETKNGWGRTNKGWIKMEYVNTTGSNTGTTNNNDKDDNNVTITGNGSTTVQFKGIVTASELNVRTNASQSATRVGMLKYGARVEILEKSGTWGRTKDGWISLSYVYQDGTTGRNTGAGVVTGTQLNIRSGPGTGYGSVGSYNQGDRVTILDQFTYDGVTWGCTNKGWISLQYVQMDNANVNTNTNTGRTGTVTGNDVNVRSGPGTNYGAIGQLNSGDKVTVVSTTVVGTTTWGNIQTGWISMTYVQLD